MDMGMMGGYGDWNGDWMGGGGGGWNDWSMDWGMMDMMVRSLACWIDAVSGLRVLRFRVLGFRVYV